MKLIRHTVLRRGTASHSPLASVGALLSAGFIGLAAGAAAGPAHAQGSAPKKDDAVTFRLAIPEPARFVETRTVTKGVEIGNSPTEIDKLSQTSDVLFRRTSAGFSVTIRPHLAKASEPVGAAAQGLAAMLRKFQLRYEFDAQGNLLALHGLEPLRAELNATLPPEMKPMLDALVPQLTEQLREEWRSRYTGLVGRTLKVGIRESGQMPLTLMPQLPPVTAKIARGVKGRHPCNGRDCVVYFQGYVIERADGYGEAMSKLTRDWLRQMLAGLGGAKAGPAIKQMMAEMPTLTVKEMVYVTERLVDPESLTVYQESQTKGYRAVSNRGQEMHWTEVTRVEYRPAS